MYIQHIYIYIFISIYIYQENDIFQQGLVIGYYLQIVFFWIIRLQADAADAVAPQPLQPQPMFYQGCSHLQQHVDFGAHSRKIVII